MFVFDPSNDPVARDVEDKPKVVLLMGPTASGKTDLAFELSAAFNMEIISVDSALIYRGMDIGTAKPGKEVLALVPHHLIDIRDPAESYSTAEFAADAAGLISDILSRSKTPLLVGGSMLYFHAITQGLSDLPAADAGVRREIRAQARQKGWAAMHKRLRRVDPAAARRIHPNDPQRIQRALEVFSLTGRSMTENTQAHRPQGLPYDFVKLAVAPRDRAILHRRIERRFDKMLQAGFVDEVARLKARGDLHAEKPSMRCVGYRQIWRHLDGGYDLAEARLRGIYASRQLAKRQLTRLRSILGINWFYSAEEGAKHAHVARFMREIFS